MTTTTNTNWTVTHKKFETPAFEYWLVEADNQDGTFARVYRREAKRGPKWAVYLRHSQRMMSHHAIIWAEIVAAVEARLAGTIQ